MISQFHPENNGWSDGAAPNKKEKGELQTVVLYKPGNTNRECEVMMWCCTVMVLC